ncbi:MAG TPA: hypothetical protein VMU05_18375 [Dongiaceae bacterium]|nr:hypothetical protein [Dongiaceae bacterium]
MNTRYVLIVVLLETVVGCAQVRIIGTATVKGSVSLRSSDTSHEIRPTAVPSSFFGIHFKSTTPWPEIPFGSLRLWDSGTRWQQNESGQSVYDFSALDTYLRSAKSHGLAEVLLTLSATPQWASSDPTNTRCDYAYTSNGSCAPPTDLNPDGTGPNQYWRDYTYNLGGHLAALDGAVYARVTGFSMWNEFTRSQDSSLIAWEGTNEQLVRIVEDANCILTGRGEVTTPCSPKAMNEPGIGLLAGSRLTTPDSVLTLPQSSNYQLYLQAAGALAAADVIAVHGYVQNGSCCSNAETLITRMNTLKSIIPSSATTLPIWSTEGGWGTSQANLPDPDMQAAFVARYYLIGWAQGFQRLYWYAYDNPTWGTLWNPDGVNGCSDRGTGRGCLTKAGVAYASIYSWMVDSEMSTPCVLTGTTWSCGLTDPQGRKRLAVWDAAQTCSGGVCTASTYTVDSMYKTYLELDGLPAKAVTGQRVQVGAKPILLQQN